MKTKKGSGRHQGNNWPPIVTLGSRLIKGRESITPSEASSQEYMAASQQLQSVGKKSPTVQFFPLISHFDLDRLQEFAEAKEVEASLSINIPTLKHAQRTNTKIPTNEVRGTYVQVNERGTV